MKKRYVLFIFIAILSFQEFSFAQSSLWRFKRKEVLFGTGATNFFGDLGGANQIGTNGIRDFDFKAIRPAF
ncbi:MAG: hypothetical protein HGB12_09020, partial [Bacteroidetes bacterium]|nr:hypothetical protein [Bacteroidota bacterium]